MNPVWFVTRVAGVTILTAAGMSLLVSKAAPKPTDLIAGAAHFRSGMTEFRKAFESILGVSPDTQAKKNARDKNASRIEIE
jgi:hypothetical protein